MNTLEKLKVLGAGSRYDACSCTPSQRRETNKQRVGDAVGCAVVRSATPDGKPVSLFKTLYTNACRYDCRYCPNSTRCSKKPVSFEPEELAKTFMTLYIRNYVEGLFLSSGILKNADYTTERMLETIALLRTTYQYRGYIHLKILPGTNRALVKQCVEVADRVSINLESPNQSRLNELSSIKTLKGDIIKRQRWMHHAHPKAGHSTQLVVGAAGESDKEILQTTAWEYREVGLHKAYYSAFSPVKQTPLSSKTRTPLEREQRLYHADYLLRTYKYPFKDIRSVMVDENLPRGDPKVHIALRFFDRPLDPNQASYEELIRVPGIGPRSAMRILDLRKKHHRITRYLQLHSIGVVLKRAKPFLEVNGKRQKMLMEFS